MITPFQIATFFVYSIAIILAFYFSSSIAENGEAAFIKILGAMGSVAWILFGSRVWWLPLFWGIGFGGVFYFGFKIYAHEAALALALVTVVPAIILQRMRLRPRQDKLPWTLHLLFIYLAMECLGSCVLFGSGGFYGVGGIFRTYFAAVWPYFFLVGFAHYGFSHNICWGLYALQIGYRLRIAIIFATFLSPGFLYLPGINFVLPGSVLGGKAQDGFDALRSAGLGLALVSLAFLFSRRGIFLARKTLYFTAIQILRFLIGVVALLFGSGRGILIECGFAFLFALVYGRKWIFLGIVLALGLGGVGVINSAPSVIEKMPPRMQRTLSVLMLKDASAHIENLNVEGSDLWHKRLREISLQRWTATPLSFFFGTGIKPFDLAAFQDTSSPDVFEESLQNAADIGAYETGIATVLTTTGLVGLTLYLLLIYQFIREIFRLKAVADQDSFGRALVFYALCQAVLWLLAAYFTGSWPSFELITLGITLLYLQDRAREQETLQPVKDAVPFPELMKSSG